MLSVGGKQLSDYEAAARAAIDRMVDRQIIKSRKADWRLVAAAMEMRRGSYTDEIDAAEAMCKTKARRRDVAHWVDLLGQLEQRDLIAADGSSTSCTPRRSARLLVQSAWLEKNAPNLSKFTADSPVPFDVSNLGLGSQGIYNLSLQHSKRTLRATASTPGGSQHQAHGTVVYTLPPSEGESESDAKRRRMRHRSREVEAIHRMSGASVQINAARAERIRQVRECSRTAGERQREVQIVLEDMLVQVERLHRHLDERGTCKGWCCPAGCESDALGCGRAAFRLQCMPSAEAIRKEQYRLWRNAVVGACGTGEFRGPSGYAYGSAMQLQLYLEQEDELARVAPEQLSSSEVDAIQSTFLHTWDGQIEPSSWLHSWLELGVVATGHREYLGECLTHPYGGRLPCDRFGPDHYPVGPSACMRRGCYGCCYCLNEELPIYVQMRMLKPPVWVPHRWVEATSAWVEPWRRSEPEWVLLEELPHKLALLARVPCEEPLPAFLLSRRSVLTSHAGGNSYHLEEHEHGRGVVCLPVVVHELVSADQIAAWSEHLAAVSIRLEVFDAVGDLCVLEEISKVSLISQSSSNLPLAATTKCDSLMCVPNVQTKARIDAYLAEQARLIEADIAQELKESHERQQVHLAFKRQAQLGCGEVVPFRVGRLVYIPWYRLQNDSCSDLSFEMAALNCLRLSTSSSPASL